MKHRQKILIAFTAFCIFLTIACQKNGDVVVATDPLSALNLPANPFSYANQSLPAYFQTPPIVAADNTPVNNQVSDWGATLGRVLFYDKTVSINNAVSCASCHKQQFGFSDTGILSKGFAGGLTGRHSMTLTNARYYPNKKFFWDERAATLEIQVLTPIQDHTEMGMNLDTLTAILRSKSYYPVLFKNAFGDTAVTSKRIAQALSQFVRSIISYRTKFDTGRTNVAPGADPIRTPYSNYTAAENLGKDLFFSPQLACATCHGTETFTAPGDRNNGIDNPSVDKGVGGVTNIAQQVGNFKSSSLKNIEFTAPYMHDGRFKTLDEVVEFYNSGIKPNPNLAPQLKNPDGTPKRFNLTADQKTALVAFLKTLTDHELVKDEKFSNPFK